ncbi:MAG: hypothetical protein KGJ80_01675 [Chloroflexota bacterium]|nr:hypothetical protein [Chloroflexota bacterium]
MFRSFASQLGSAFIALVLAITVWYVATSAENPSRQAFYPSGLPIEFVNRADNLIVFQKSADSVQVELRAPQASWDQLRPSAFHVVADLKSLGAGTHPVKLTVQVNDPRVAVTTIEPADVVNVQLEQIKSREMDAHSEVLDVAPLGYASKSPVVAPAQVTVSGPAVLVDQVNEVVADVYLRGAKTSIERDVAALARDAQGNAVQGVTVTPATVNVKVQVDQRVGYKDVSIKTVLKGTVASGYWVSNITVSPSSATLVGGPDVMAKITGFVETVPIDISGATSDLSRRAVLSLPEGVSVLNNEGITVQVAVTPIMGGQTVRRKIVLQGLTRGLNASISPDSIDVILSGPLPSLQSLTTDDVQVVVDVAALTMGTYVLRPRVTLVPDPLKVQSIVPDTVQIVITPTPATITPSAATTTPTPAPSPTPIR